MRKEKLLIKDISVMIWGENSDKVIIAIHGNMSNKKDKVIEILAEKYTQKGYQILSFDLPKNEDNTLCKVFDCVESLKKVYNYSEDKWRDISIFAVSIGAYFSLIAYPEKNIKKVWFLSPVVDMERVIENMMSWFNISLEELREKKEVKTPIGETIYLDYYQYVKNNQIKKWDFPTKILYGDKDEISEREIIEKFSKKFKAELSIVKDTQHYFHREEDLEIFKKWL